MASTISPALLLFFLLVSHSQALQFHFNGFLGREDELTMEGSVVKPDGALRLTNKSKNATGHAFFSQPVPMLRRSLSSSSSPNASSFSAYFVFAIVPPNSGKGGYGLAFTLSPSKEFPGGAAEHYLGIFNSTNDGKSTNHIFAVEFDTVNGFNDDSDTAGNHVGININSMISNESEPAYYYNNASGKLRKEDVDLHGGEPIQAWIAYDGIQKVVKVTIAKMWKEKPSKPLLSVPNIDLTSVVKEAMYVGFSAATGTKKASSHYVLGWSFSTSGEAPSLNLSQLPIPPRDKDPTSFQPLVIALIAALCSVTVILLGILLSITVYRRMVPFETLEDWELECPHRFSYRDLHAATKGFKETEIIGEGGCGAVYKAVMPTAGNEVAVKKITRNSAHGLREFAAEIESLGRLRHKNLVNLQGWCKRKNDLLLVYDYVPNGSLDSLLYRPRNNMVLTWEQRFNILKGVASGLLYLHEEWEQVVIHRDVKSSNVLIDAEMNGRLGDFGLARLYDHGTVSHTTNIVGTIGYIAPELARTGKASARSDVFAYGVVLLEVACGRRPIEPGPTILADWVMESQQLGRILDAVDPKLGSRYVIEEVELVLGLGLLCSHQMPEARPSMRQVTRYLNGDDKLPAIDEWLSIDSQRLAEMNSRLLKMISADMITTSHASSNTGGILTNSIDAGR